MSRIHGWSGMRDPSKQYSFWKYRAKPISVSTRREPAKMPCF